MRLQCLQQQMLSQRQHRKQQQLHTVTESLPPMLKISPRLTDLGAVMAGIIGEGVIIQITVLKALRLPASDAFSALPTLSLKWTPLSRPNFQQK